MKNREQILAAIQDIMVEMFEMDPDRIEPEARLYEDLDFDSIDAVDMIVRLKELTGKMVKPEDFKTARTIGDVVEAVHRLMQD
ncbi:acyl carrier protein [Methylomonas sp. EFPC3]|uniref:acyl carrier protein n=1 Tax=unclassified Methylomonas TaxID=2608980 RepID=UPI002417EA0C|nr:acyl carrier protein [Methylomonas sp. EFPC3]WFP50261.1 acyl carrier protein [Methylomonas sp. EFPC3]